MSEALYAAIGGAVLADVYYYVFVKGSASKKSGYGMWTYVGIGAVSGYAIASMANMDVASASVGAGVVTALPDAVDAVVSSVVTAV